MSCASMRLVRAPSVRAAEEEEDYDLYTDLYTDEEYEELEEAFESTRAEDSADRIRAKRKIFTLMDKLRKTFEFEERREELSLRALRSILRGLRMLMSSIRGDDDVWLNVC